MFALKKGSAGKEQATAPKTKPSKPKATSVKAKPKAKATQAKTSVRSR